jgi:O-methyltransferase
MLFQNVIEQRKLEKQLHVYDSFEVMFTKSEDIQKILIANFHTAKLKLPIVHKGYFHQTLTKELSDEIAFVHLDCGYGGDKIEHKEILIFCLNHAYPRLSKGAVCILMDYKDEDGCEDGNDINPGTRLAADEFLEGKPETIVGLYGNQCYHGYFVKK